MFISFCGLDGCGKTTQAELIIADKDFNQQFEIASVHGFKPAKYSKELKDLAKRMNDKFETLYSAEIKTMSFVMDLLFMSFENESKFKSKNHLLICEKYYLDTIIYSPMLGCNEQLIQVMDKVVIQPDLYIMLNITPDESIKRIQRRAELTGQDIAPKENIDMARKASKKFLDYCFSRQNCIILDANLDEISLHNKIKQTIMDYVEQRNCFLLIGE